MLKRKIVAGFIICAVIGGVIGYMVAPKQPGKVTIEHWTSLTEPDRVATLKSLAHDFTLEHPDIEVKIVPVNEDDYPEKIAAAKLAGTLPDSMRLFLDYAGTWVTEGIVDPAPATEIINELGPETWGAGALELVKNPTGSGYSLVPTDGWPQGIWYRKDLFDAKGLAPPNTWANIKAACEALHDPPNLYGIVLGTHPEKAYTQQCYEQFALGAGARAFDTEGNIMIGSPEQVEALTFYTDLAKYTPPTPCTWKEANTYYLTGKTAMMMYSTYIMDDILGVDERDWSPIEGLPEKTRFATKIEGPEGYGTYGTLMGTAISTTANEKTETWVKYVVDERLYDYVSMSIVGMMPARNTVIEKWKEHEYFKAYAPGFAEDIISGFDAIGRWGYREGNYFPEIGEIYGGVLVPRAIGDIIDGVKSPQEASDWLQTELE